jgi:C4-dicarboxylate-specific signal transduction histidine kinase
MGTRYFAIYIYLLVTINIFAIGYLNDIGYIQNDKVGSGLSVAIILAIILTFISYIAWLISKEMAITNNALRESKEELERRVKQRTFELEKSLENLTEAQDHIIQTEKMASLGRLVAGVAHEINTPIGISITASSFLEDSIKNFSKLYDDNAITKQAMSNHIELSLSSSALIQTNLVRAAELIQGFKEVSVDQSSNAIREINLQHYLSEIIASLLPTIKQSKCQINVSCTEMLIIRTSPGTIAQIITNLITNALIHAFEDNQPGIININVKQRNDNIILRFKDSGSGITPENLINIFEPFFTTKRGSGGSGLGMHIVYNLVTQSLNGTIECKSTVGEGTNFLIQFPCNIDTKVTLP